MEVGKLVSECLKISKNIFQCFLEIQAQPVQGVDFSLPNKEASARIQYFCRLAFLRIVGVFFRLEK